MPSKRYSISKFPSYYGTPVQTNSLLLAYIIAFLRGFMSICEIRIIDNETKEHIYVN